VSQSVCIPGRFNGPLTSGHGGYCSGVIAEFVEGPGEVTLRSPVPLDTELDVVRESDGSVRVLHEEELVAEAHPGSKLDVQVPEPVTPGEARQATEHYLGSADGLFGRCFVCGRGREDALGVFAGTVGDREVVASPWTPPDWTADADGRVLPQFVWAVLDCPTYFAVYTDGELPMSFLGRMAVQIDAPVPAGEEHVVIAWPLGVDGRKRHAGAAVLSSEGVPLAVARVLMIEPREGSSG
jgi:hypothetical protein